MKRSRARFALLSRRIVHYYRRNRKGVCQKAGRRYCSHADPQRPARS
jgi:hypothetical protein